MTVSAEVIERARGIRLAVFDVDGVLTDGRLYFAPEGPEMKVFHARDGLGIKLLRRHGIEVAVISGRQSPVVARRMDALGVTHVYQGNDDKLPILRDLLKKLSLAPQACAYVGDDVIDLPPMSVAGLACTVADAHPAVRRAAHWITAAPGGQGSAREVCDLILTAQSALPDEWKPIS
ncbi:3-deoxy-manno-octulosonate-8-phosphatase KdsC [Candidatus Macondimonas diazotrophica]|jgi:3-deoxy-D-manno-octulosonate 8-phosphate phosphatase (KDO 8-P phosphatase)|uniref:3-deoxy-D-manno-octulosonate 8-phosphate phosphatase KdsC n=1 Tax=Candidatus Macondimonas diazotrophica TaxID=2305248 RepID=A0A4Z0FCK1_9GAMM|nr:3-deoxy-manno-octulosonate-8-phosphatase KdsC [Candidatus Macondimonas diazotrophica]NCT99900.1 3-deoxy-manno-octulosonate-8-phosphatase KdsC [Candidatus Macondimonas diazotrophica]TFZ83710.1 3-deoxy-manno-octulosonate-8-phosphatase KdsC [Candidatus Macondimonas diazotrophica]